ncbi:class C sortase [Blautia sp. MSJ-19]|uniref:class C sortase n=1 Tax=Blautia sp. MSJ-19 TaxID=2841517 RepID=UPI001C0F2385|nr:class C sortase [Blautia sp. MSJ-19]MBU5482667.1 class C sortase [Blautia sp. MSJ-19]
MKKQNIIFFLFLLAGLGVLNYPFISQRINQRNQSQVIYGYEDAVDDLDNEDVEKMFHDANTYNVDLLSQTQELMDSFNESGDTGREKTTDQAYARYESLLNPSGNGLMGYLEIPAIGADMPVFHGTGERALEQGAGHLYGTSLPVGGKGSHAVLAAHTGIASKMLFTDLDQLKEGDCFYLHILGETLAYQVDQAVIVLPEETELLEIDKNKDYVTLVTCTPYGINSHRLLVRGMRIPYEEAVEQEVQQAESGFRVWGRRVFVLSVLFLLGAGIVLLKPQKERRKESED